MGLSLPLDLITMSYIPLTNQLLALRQKKNIQIAWFKVFTGTNYRLKKITGRENIQAFKNIHQL